MISEREIMRYEEYIKTQFKKLDESSLIREDKIPDLDLYIDQAEMFFKYLGLKIWICPGKDGRHESDDQ